MKEKKINIKETNDKIVMEVSLPERYYVREQKMGFSLSDALQYLAKENISFESIAEGNNLILRNYDDIQLTGHYVFNKKVVTKKPKQAPKKRISKPRAKKVAPPTPIEEQVEEPKVNVRDRVKRISQKRNTIEEE